MRAAAFPVLLAAACFAQGPAALIDVGSPGTIVVAGTRMQLTAVVRDLNGVARPGDPVAWASGDERILAVDSSGAVTAGALGIAEIVATSGQARTAVEIQVLPSRLEIVPSSLDLEPGQTAQLTARAYDAAGGEITAQVQWEAVAESGDRAAFAGVGEDGLVSALGLGRAEIRAVIPYEPPRHEGKLPRYAVSIPLTIRERPFFRLRRVLSSRQTLTGFSLRPTFTGIASNDAGQVAFLGSLDGVSTGLLLYDAGQFRLLANGGTPAVAQGQVITEVGRPAINRLGQVLSRIRTATIDGGRQGGLFVASAAGGAFQLLEGTGLGEFVDLGFFDISPYSLNDNGSILFRANHRPPESAAFQTSLFVLSRGSLEEIYNQLQRLPGLDGLINIEFDFALDNQEGVFFVARSGARRVLYRRPAGGAPVKIIGIGDAFAGSVIDRMEDLVFSPAGEAAFRVDLRTGKQFLVRWAGNRLDSKELSGSPHTLAVNSGADVLFTGTVTGKEGLYRWTGADFQPLLPFGPAAGGLPAIRSVDGASLSASGGLTVWARTPDNDFAVIRPGAARPLLFQSGARLEVTANLHIRALVQGSRDGPAHVALGEPASLFELASTGNPVPRVLLGDRVAGAASFAGAASPVESPRGELYFSSRENLFRLDGGLYRYAAGRLERLLEDTRLAADRVRLYYPEPHAANGAGTVALTTGSDQGRYRLYLLRGGQLTLIQTSGALSPSGGTVDYWTQVAIDEQERVMAYFQVSSGASGYFLYEAGKWRPVALPGVFTLNGRTVAAADGLRALDNQFYALFSLEQRYADSAVAAFDGAWRALLVSGEQMAAGGTVGYIQEFDVNRGGDVAFITTLRGAAAKTLGVKLGGALRTVVSPSDPTPAGDYLGGFVQVDLRDDRRLYFSAINALDDYVLYAAEPL